MAVPSLVRPQIASRWLIPCTTFARTPPVPVPAASPSPIREVVHASDARLLSELEEAGARGRRRGYLPLLAPAEAFACVRRAPLAW